MLIEGEQYLLLKSCASSIGKEDWKQRYQTQICHHRLVEKHWPMWLYTVHFSGDAPEAGREEAPGHVTVLPQIRHTFLVWASNRRRLFLPRVFQWPHHTVLGEDRQTDRQTHGLEGWDCSPVVPPPGKHSHQRHILLRTKPRPGYWRESGVNTGHCRIDQTLGDQSSGGFRAEATGVIS